MTWGAYNEKEELKKIVHGYLYAVFTDKLMLTKWPLNELKKTEMEKNFPKLLECRIFNENAEYRIARSDLGKKWKERLIDDSLEAYQDYFIEEQYLDIDDNRVSKNEDGYWNVTATGGGSYELPLSDYKDAKIRIKNYMGYYEETGQAYIKDWRLAGFLNEKG